MQPIERVIFVGKGFAISIIGALVEEREGVIS